MVKVITIRDETYKRLAKVKVKLGGSFSDAIDYLIEQATKRMENETIFSLAGSLGRRDISKERLRKVMRWLK